MLIVNYHSTNGQAVRDGQVQYFAQTALNKSRMPNKRKKPLYSVLIASKAVMREFQQMVKDKKVDTKEIRFLFENARIPVKPDGSFILSKNHELMK